MITLWHQKSQNAVTSCTSKFLFLVSLLNLHDNYDHAMSCHALRKFSMIFQFQETMAILCIYKYVLIETVLHSIIIGDPL